MLVCIVEESFISAPASACSPDHARASMCPGRNDSFSATSTSRASSAARINVTQQRRAAPRGRFTFAGAEASPRPAGERGRREPSADSATTSGSRPQFPARARRPPARELDQREHRERDLEQIAPRPSPQRGSPPAPAARRRGPPAGAARGRARARAAAPPWPAFRGRPCARRCRRSSSAASGSPMRAGTPRCARRRRGFSSRSDVRRSWPSLPRSA